MNDDEENDTTTTATIGSMMNSTNSADVER